VTFFRAAPLALLMMIWAVAAHAAETAQSSWHETEQTRARLVAAVTGTGSAERLRLGLEFHMRPGWKIYWRSPGDAGIPPRPRWDGSDNLKSAKILWPAPERFSVLGLETLGYKKEVVLPIDAVPVEPGKPLAIKAEIPYLTCDDICIPYTANLDLVVPAGAAEPSGHAHLISRYAAKVPGDGAGHGLMLADSAALSPKDTAKGEMLISVRAKSETPFSAPDIYLEGPEVLAYSKPHVTFSDNGHEARLDVTVYGVKDLDGGAGRLAKETLTATLVDGPRSAERPLSLSPGELAPPADAPTLTAAEITPAPQPNLLLFVALAVLGGLILNLMPCVLPVLSIKVLGVMGHGGGDTRAVRHGFIASALGILASFMVLASGLVALKAAGMTIGWGIQFQQPWFLVAMAVIVFVFACNLFGFFDIALPQAIGDMGAHAADANHHTGPLGHFLQGALATLLATPCSAPFLGTAVGFALARGPLEIYAIFAGLAFGLALPYLAVAAMPAAATRLPRPGPWMIRLRQILGLALLATAGWLLWVTSGILGQPAMAGLLIGLAVLGGILWLAGRGIKPARALVPGLPIAIGVALVLAAAVLPAGNVEAPRGGGEADLRGAGKNAEFRAHWQPLDEARIARLVADGKTVLVDVTADWCITCQVNKRLVLNQGAVKAAIMDGRIVAMIADWTRPDPVIAAYLAKFGRYGIPFNAVYGPQAPNGIPLPELLTETAVTEAVAQAGNVVIAKN
jgi:suppressor for copper-sensitivity B